MDQHGDLLPGGHAKAVEVEAMFDRIASHYDLMNDVMTGGLHRLWKLDTLRALGNRRHANVLDIATGTGDLALTLVRSSRTAQVVGLDFSAQMLVHATHRSQTLSTTSTDRLTWLRGDAMNLPFATSSFSAVTSAFALRNVAHLEQMIDEIARALGPGGRVALLDLVPNPDPSLVTRLAQLHRDLIVPRVGRLIVSDAAYLYLPKSVDNLPPVPAICALLTNAGFTAVQHRYLGFGTVALLTGTRR